MPLSRRAPVPLGAPGRSMNDTTRWRCDFCAAPDPVWLYPARTVPAYQVSAATTDYTGESEGAWLACADCRTFIERASANPVDRVRFARRCATTLGRRLQLSQRQVLPQVEQIHAGFFANRLGTGRSWTAADASDEPPPPLRIAPLG